MRGSARSFKPSMCRKRAGPPARFRAKHALGLDPGLESAVRVKKTRRSKIWIARSAVQQKSSMKARVRGAGRNASVGLGSSGMIVMVHAAGTLDLFSTIDRTWPVTADPAERTVAVLPLNWAIRKRRTSF
jgi:hypothetical protein